MGSLWVHFKPLDGELKVYLVVSNPVTDDEVVAWELPGDNQRGGMVWLGHYSEFCREFRPNKTLKAEMW